MKDIILKIETPKGLTFNDVSGQVRNGGKFVAFAYLFPRPIFPPVKRISRIYFLNPGEKASKYSFKYNLATLLIGWWGLPFGPYYTFIAIKGNKEGIDFTEDVLGNLTHEDFEKGVVTIKKISSVFIHPDKSSLKGFLKCFKVFSEKSSKLKSNPFVGKFIDTENPYFIIGLSENDIDKKEAIKESLYKYFYSHIKFEFININDNSELSEKLLTQGVEIIVISK